jgi:hypothetical protein
MASLLSAPKLRKPACSLAFLLGLGALPGALGACSSGESGLILGHPLPQSLGGGGATAGTGGTKSPAAAGGDDGGAGGHDGGSGGTAGTGGASGGTDPAGGKAGSGGTGGTEDPPWIAERCSPTLNVENRDTTSKGQLFDDAMPMPKVAMLRAAHTACRTLYRAPDEVPSVHELTLVIEDYAGVAGTAGGAIRISSSYLESYSNGGGDLSVEIAGIVHFTTSLVYQNNAGGTAPVWLVTGIADFVRLQANLVERAQPTRGGNYDDSSQLTALFFDYLRSSNPDIVYLLNQSIALKGNAWSEDVFVDLMGSDLQTLWASYQATLPE